MNRNTLLGGALLLLLAAIFMPRILPDGRNYPDTLAQVDSAAVDELRITFRQDSVVLQRRDGQWWITGQPGLPADPVQVARLLDQLEDLSVLARAHDNTGGEADARYQLDAEGSRRVTVIQGGTPVLQARFGKSSEDFANCFARLEGEEPIYRLAVNLSGRFNARPGAWLRRQLFDYDPERLTGLGVFHPDGRREDYRLADSLWLADVIQADSSLRYQGVTVNASVLAGMKAGVARLRISDIAADSLVAGVHPDSLALRVQFTVDEGQTHTVTWYHSPAAENRMLCRVDDQDPWYEIPAATLDRYTVDPGEVVQSARN
jgi:hypothetical protein